MTRILLEGEDLRKIIKGEIVIVKTLHDEDVEIKLSPAVQLSLIHEYVAQAQNQIGEP
jgi:hypothetical protein